MPEVFSDYSTESKNKIVNQYLKERGAGKSAGGQTSNQAANQAREQLASNPELAQGIILMLDLPENRGVAQKTQDANKKGKDDAKATAEKFKGEARDANEAEVTPEQADEIQKARDKAQGDEDKNFKEPTEDQLLEMLRNSSQGSLVGGA